MRVCVCLFFSAAASRRKQRHKERCDIDTGKVRLIASAANSTLFGRSIAGAFIKHYCYCSRTNTSTHTHQHNALVIRPLWHCLCERRTPKTRLGMRVRVCYVNSSLRINCVDDCANFRDVCAYPQVFKCAPKTPTIFV